MPRESQEVCKNCRHFYPAEYVHGLSPQHGSPQCRLRAPRPGVNEKNLAMWPIVSPTDMCGEWMEKD